MDAVRRPRRRKPVSILSRNLLLFFKNIFTLNTTGGEGNYISDCEVYSTIIYKHHSDTTIKKYLMHKIKSPKILWYKIIYNFFFKTAINKYLLTDIIASSVVSHS